MNWKWNMVNMRRMAYLITLFSLSIPKIINYQKGVTFDYDDGTEKESVPDKIKDKKGEIEISYSAYINKDSAYILIKEYPARI